MAGANIQIVRQLYAAFAKRNIPAILDMLTPDVEWAEPMNPLNLTAGTRHGHDGFLQWADVGRRAEEILVLEPKRMLVDEDSVKRSSAI